MTPSQFTIVVLSLYGRLPISGETRNGVGAEASLRGALLLLRLLRLPEDEVRRTDKPASLATSARLVYPLDNGETLRP